MNRRTENPIKERKKATFAVLLSLTVAVSVCFSASGCAPKETWRDQEQARTLIRASLEFAEAHGGTYPNSVRWEEEMKPYLPQKFRFTLESNPSHRFAMNSVFSQKNMATVSRDLSQAVVFFESTASESSAHDELTSLPRSGKTVVLAFQPGHVYAHPIEWADLLNDPIQHKRIVGR